jgi:hypothetical protein
LARKQINGLPAIVGAFEAQTEQAMLGGVATFVALDERTYRILAYTPVQQRAAYDKTFRASMNSFARLTNAKALARQPQRLVHRARATRDDPGGVQSRPIRRRFPLRNLH